jgi:hypothetical protein
VDGAPVRAAAVLVIFFAEPPAPAPRAVDWSLSGAGARSLIVQPGTTGGCDQGDPKVTVEESARRITVSVTILSVQGPDVVCPAIARLNTPVTVRLDAPVAGRAVVGEGRDDHPGAALEQARPDAPRPRVPRVLGLSAADARAALCNWRLAATPSSGRGRVVGQSLAAGSSYRVPTGAAPESCAGLPARPGVRLTLR